MRIRRALLVAVLTTTAVLASGSDAFASGGKLTEGEASSALDAAGIGWLSSGNCVERSNPHCTSYEQINSGTVDGVLVLQQASGCSIVISGGTEAGHAPGAKSHSAGYKVDISHDDCIDDYITSAFRSQPPTFGTAQYVSARGNVYTDEGNHWDVLFP
jgi:hypothetical protein